MTVDAPQPTFNLKAVVRETGIKPDTLRAWERRYGLPCPQRTAGGHRLYSQRDIDMIRWFLARQQEGLSISRAVELWKTLEAQGIDPLTHPDYSLPDHLAPSSWNMSSSPWASGEQMRQAWVEACMALDEEAAEQVLIQAFTAYPIELVCREVIQAGLREIGERWYQGKASVQQEHLASALAMRRLNVMLAAAPTPTRSGHILLACPPQEDHVVSSLILALFLRRRGWRTTFLGARVPLEQMNETLLATRPNVVVLSAQQLFTAAYLRRMAQAVDAQGVTVTFGGRVFVDRANLISRITGHYLGPSLEEAVFRIESLLSRRMPNPQAQPTDPTYQELWNRFQQVLPMIHAQVSQQLANLVLPPEHLYTALAFFSQDIAAALELGDMDLLTPELMWVQPLLDHYRVNGERLTAFLTAYREAVAALLPPPNPLHGWLTRVQDMKNLIHPTQ